MDNLQKGTPGQTISLDKTYSISMRYNGYLNLIGYTEIMTIGEAKYKMKNELIMAFKFPVTYQNSTFDNYDKKENPEAYQKIKDIANAGFVDQLTSKNISVILWSKGVYGVGKTHLLYAMVKNYLTSDKLFAITKLNEETIEVSYKAMSIGVLTEYELLNKVKDTFKSDSEKSEGDIFRELNKYQILCIDDLVKYVPANLDFYQRVMFQIIDERYNANKSLILTTNKTLVELAEFVGIPSADRLNEMTRGYRLEFKGVSHRGK